MLRRNEIRLESVNVGNEMQVWAPQLVTHLHHCTFLQTDLYSYHLTAGIDQALDLGELFFLYFKSEQSVGEVHWVTSNSLSLLVTRDSCLREVNYSQKSEKVEIFRFLKLLVEITSLFEEFMVVFKNKNPALVIAFP